MRSIPQMISVIVHAHASIFRNLYSYTGSGILAVMPKAIPTLKPVTFLGSSRDDLRDMPETVRHAMGVELMTVQLGGTPTDFKPIASIGIGPMRSASAMWRERFARCT